MNVYGNQGAFDQGFYDALNAARNWQAFDHRNPATWKRERPLMRNVGPIRPADAPRSRPTVADRILDGAKRVRLFMEAGDEIFGAFHLDREQPGSLWRQLGGLAYVLPRRRLITGLGYAINGVSP